MCHWRVHLFPQKGVNQYPQNTVEHIIQTGVQCLIFPEGQQRAVALPPLKAQNLQASVSKNHPALLLTGLVS